MTTGVDGWPPEADRPALRGGAAHVAHQHGAKKLDDHSASVTAESYDRADALRGGDRMAWHITGNYMAPCSCHVACPCLFGELDGDQGWCSGVLAFDIASGDVDGVDVGGTKVALIGDWPRGFLAGDGTGRVYFDKGVSAERRQALEPVLQGRAGGTLEALSQLIPNWLPSDEADVELEFGADEVKIGVSGVGSDTSQVLKGPNGDPTKVLHGAAAFREETTLGKSGGGSFKPQGMREWSTGGHSEFADFDWSG
jgi:hypothetical protein